MLNQDKNKTKERLMELIKQTRKLSNEFLNFGVFKEKINKYEKHIRESKN
jgi:hypothetical protein